MDLSICRKDVVEWLTDEQWIVFSFYGGFARSDLGISTFEYTFQAVSVLRRLGF